LFTGPVLAQTANTTVANVNVLNLLSPFLSLDATATGQQTLNLALSDALALNQFAAANLTVASVSISDKTIFSGNSTSITLSSGASKSYGPGANLAGGLPLQAVQTPGTIAPFQQYGGLGTLGAAFQTAVSPTGAAVPSVVTLLNNAYNFTSTDLGVAKNYFANGTINGTTTAVAPAGTTLPTAFGFPNTLTSVYDTAFGVSNTGAGQDVYGDSRPVQVSSAFIPYDPTALTGLATNPAFPSGHTNYAFTDSILIGMLEPQFYQSMLLRASEYGQSRNDLGLHYILDIVGSRAFASYDLAQLLNGNSSAYLQTNAATGATAQNLSTQFQTAAQSLNAYLQTQTAACGGSLAACAANNPYNTYSATTYGSQPYVSNPGTTTASINAAIYAGRLTGGLPTLSYAQAPREQAPAGAADASILLATLYGGSSTAAKALATSVGGALYGNLSTSTINQIIVNTETNALAAFYGTSLSYWARINLYAAAGYFQNVIGAFTFAPGDQVNTNVTVASTGVLSGSGQINGNLVFQSGSALATQGTGTQATAPLTVNGTTALQAGSKVQVGGLVLPGLSYKLISGTGAITVDPSVTVDTSQGTGLVPTLNGSLVVAADPGLSVRLQSNFGALALTSNQRAVASALDAGGNAGTYGTSGTALLTNLIQNNTPASAPGAFNSLSGEGLAGQQQAVLNANDLFTSTVMDVARGGLTSDAIVQTGSRRVWATGFGQSASLDGSAGAGSASWSSTLAGFAAGTDYRFDNGLTVGLAGGYSDVNFSVSNRSTSGDSTGGHVALYAIQRFGAAYLTGVFDAGFFQNNTNRLALGTSATSSFRSTEVLGRAEAGRAFAFAPVTVTPFAGFQVAGLYDASFIESGGNNAALGVNSRSVGSQKLYLGGQVDTTQAFGGVSLTPYARLAWEHEFSTDRSVNATLLALPGSNFTVYGAPAVSDAARVQAGVKLNINQSLGVYAGFDGSFSGSGNSYAGKGGLRYTW
jgi:uncharacterized protein with beta-barrel porin domain/membrane-associated phospholipid phosphatase